MHFLHKLFYECYSVSSPYASCMFRGLGILMVLNFVLSRRLLFTFNFEEKSLQLSENLPNPTWN